MKFNKRLFEKGCKVLIANEVEEDMIIALSNNRYFYVCSIDKHFINNKVANLYHEDDEDIKPEHTMLDFFNENDSEILSIPGTAEVIAYKRIMGNHSINEQ